MASEGQAVGSQKRKAPRPQRLTGPWVLSGVAEAASEAAGAHEEAAAGVAAPPPAMNAAILPGQRTPAQPVAHISPQLSAGSDDGGTSAGNSGGGAAEAAGAASRRREPGRRGGRRRGGSVGEGGGRRGARVLALWHQHHKSMGAPPHQRGAPLPHLQALHAQAWRADAPRGRAMPAMRQQEPRALRNGGLAAAPSER